MAIYTDGSKSWITAIGNLVTSPWHGWRVLSYKIMPLTHLKHHVQLPFIWGWSQGLQSATLFYRVALLLILMTIVKDKISVFLPRHYSAINLSSLVIWPRVSQFPVSGSGSRYQRTGGTLSGWREMNILFTPLLTNEDCSPSALHNCSFNFSVLVACPGTALKPLPLNEDVIIMIMIAREYPISFQGIFPNGSYSEWN